MNEKLKEKTNESLSSVLPITMIVLLLSVTLVPMEVGTILLFLVGAVLLIIGMGFFQLGAEVAMTPLGQGIGGRIVRSKSKLAAILICFAVGAIITIAEPDLQVLANQVAAIPNEVLIWTVAAGVGVFTSIAVLRILFHIPLTRMLPVFYLLLFVVSLFVPQDFLAVAFDAGGVTTGPMTVPFIMALGVGFSTFRGRKDGADDSFGLIALCSIGPILMVMLLGIFYHPTDASYTTVQLPAVVTTQDVVLQFLQALPEYMMEVLQSTLPIIGVLLLFQLLTHQYQVRQLLRMFIGFVYTIDGLILFLTGVNVGFAPVGNLLGSGLGKSSLSWLLIPIGMLIGYYIVKAEPAVQVLNEQVENITGGMISRNTMNRTLQAGVACAVGLSMLRVLTGLNIYWILIPGYAAALIMTRFVPKVFVGIAFDSGGVASGPMTSTFLLPLAMGACSAVGGNIVTDAFGVVALVALAPLIAIQLMGMIYQHKTMRHAAVPQYYDDSIVELDW
jgi:hypothetical protein